MQYCHQLHRILRVEITLNFEVLLNKTHSKKAVFNCSTMLFLHRIAREDSLIANVNFFKRAKKRCVHAKTTMYLLLKYILKEEKPVVAPTQQENKNETPAEAENSASPLVSKDVVVLLVSV